MGDVVKRQLYCLVVYVFVVVHPTGVFAEDLPLKPASQAIAGENKVIRQLLEDELKDPAKSVMIRQTLRQKLHDLLDIALLTEKALKDHWLHITVKERQKLVKILTEIIEKHYLKQLQGHLQYRIEYLSEEKNKDYFLVKTRLYTGNEDKNEAIDIDYFVHMANNTFRIFDILTDDVSLLRNYRNQFNRIIEKEGVVGLIKRMQSKLDKEQAESH